MGYFQPKQYTEGCYVLNCVHPQPLQISEVETPTPYLTVIEDRVHKEIIKVKWRHESGPVKDYYP